MESLIGTYMVIHYRDTMAWLKWHISIDYCLKNDYMRYLSNLV